MAATGGHGGDGDFFSCTSSMTTNLEEKRLNRKIQLERQGRLVDKVIRYLLSSSKK
jgi:hypothetical protein